MSDSEFIELSNYIKTQFGIDLTKKRILIEGRLSHELHKRGISTFKEYLNVVFNDKTGAEVTLLLNKLTTNLSYFMRENEHFDYLQNQVLPFFEKTKGSTRDLRIWSAGCSTGQEPYNIAMVIDEYFGSKKNRWDTTILATDISMKVLTAAQQGIYAEEDLKDISPSWKNKYFEKTSTGEVKVCDRIRNEVVFKPFNLMEPFRFKKPFDLIFCRNVMIYFDADTKATLVKKFFDFTSDGGFLFIGHSESINNQKQHYA